LLHITNGDVAVGRMREGGLPGECLPWRDVLHDGPVPLADSLEALSAIRARHLAGRGLGEASRLADEFARRDAMLARCAQFGEVVLWFEHDPYDQLQLLQVLDWLGTHAVPVPVSLIVVGAYPGIDRFVGLGQLSPAQLAGLLDTRVPATPRHFAAASQAWRAYRQPDPRAFAALLEREAPELPYLHGAVLRLLEELPSRVNGLSRTERAALEIVGRGIGRPTAVFAELQSGEERPWLGDWSFWAILAGLARGAAPLLETAGGKPFSHPPAGLQGQAFDAQVLRLTRAGREALENRRDAVKLHPVDRWLGGTRLGPGAAWRWDGQARRLVAPC
jgi:hypothetical protein